MANITSVGIDLSKNLMHIVCVNRSGSVIKRRKVSRAGFLEAVSEVAVGGTVYMEACCGAHYWKRQIEGRGITARLIDGRDTKRYRKLQKNDFLDAEAIAEAGSRAGTRFVAAKSEWQLELQAIQRIRERLIRSRTALSNEIRGFLMESGVVLPKNIRQLRRYLGGQAFVDEALSAGLRQLLECLYTELNEIDGRIDMIEKQLKLKAAASPIMERIQSIPGIGILTASAIISSFGGAEQFKNGRHLAAACGLVPRQYSTGGKTCLGSITKRGNGDVRRLMIHGARNVVRYAISRQKPDKQSLWIRKLYATKGANRTAVAIANKNLRVAYRILRDADSWFDVNRAHGAELIQ